MKEEWKNFKSGKWCNKIDVRDFIIKNYTPYEGDETFLQTTTLKTQKVWGKCTELLRRIKKTCIRY